MTIPQTLEGAFSHLIWEHKLEYKLDFPTDDGRSAWAYSVTLKQGSAVGGPWADTEVPQTGLHRSATGHIRDPQHITESVLWPTKLYIISLRALCGPLNSPALKKFLMANGTRACTLEKGTTPYSMHYDGIIIIIINTGKKRGMGNIPRTYAKVN